MRPLRHRRRQAALDPQEPAPPVGQLAAQVARIEVSEQIGEFLGDLVDVDNDRRIGEQRMHFDVGRQHAPTSIDDIRPRPA